MATELVTLDLTNLNSALYMSADAIRTIYGYMAEQTLNPDYATAARAQYEFKDSGFQDAIYDLADAIVAATGGSSGPITLDGRKVAMGTFSVSSNSTANKTITHGLGEVPEIIAVFAEGLSSGLTSHIPYMHYDTVRAFVFRFNSSGTLLSSTTTSVSPTSTEFVIPTQGYRFTAGIQYFWIALGAKPAGGGS